jgi:signal transduction histidine kinase
MPSEVSTACPDQSVDELKRELTEARDQQRATTEILSVIARSPTDSQPVFDTIATCATRLCNGFYGVVFRFDGEMITVAADSGVSPQTSAIIRSAYPAPPGSGTISSRALLERRVINVTDAQDSVANPAAAERARARGYRAILSVPMLKGDTAIGAINVVRREAIPFTDAQVELLQTFADQAVIAIENTRLFEAEQTRTRELTNALEQQRATGEILAAISGSITDAKPVFDTIVRNMLHLFGTQRGVVQILKNGMVHLAAAADDLEFETHAAHYPQTLDENSGGGRAMISKQVVQFAPVLDNPLAPPIAQSIARSLGFNSMIMAPMIRGNTVIGAIGTSRKEPKPFDDKQVALIKTFADQAVIAIENARLFEEVQERTRELGQALEYQTAISDVLGVIGRSKFDLQPVLVAIISTACRLCHAPDASIALRQGDWLEFAAGQGLSWRPNTRLPIVPGWVSGSSVLDRKTIHVDDLSSAGDEFSLGRELARSRGYKTTLAVPLIREDQAIGCLLLRRLEVQPFSEKQISLLRTFADQAVIAIENVRLFDEIAQKSRELEIASQHKSQFVANMSHELRTPLAAVLGYAELLQEGIYDVLPEKSLPILARIQSNGKHLLGLINTVLDISKIEAGQFKLTLAEYALGSIIETVMVATESLAATKKLAFKAEVVKGMPYGLGDEQRLTQVLLNLGGNAIKFTDTGEVRIAAGAANGHFELSVSDTGPGIPRHECEHIFEKFRQVDSSNTRAKGGTGLGLAIAREIVEMHGGRIWVESTLGQGSTFCMLLPVRVAAPLGAA